MRLNSKVLFAVLATAIGLAFAVAQSPNFSSQTTQIKIYTDDEKHGLTRTVPVPYREPQRILLAPVPASRFDEAWPTSGRDIGMRTDHPMECCR